MNEYLEISASHALTSLTLPLAQETALACQRNSNFEIIEFRCLLEVERTSVEIIIVDCLNDQVPTRNPAGIKTRERLALLFYSGPDKAPAVRALRRDFPLVPHLNLTATDEPKWLCLYFETWQATRRSWTPERFLQRVLWWLSSTANGKLHLADQPVERMYHESPYKIVLPPDFDQMYCENSGRAPLHLNGVSFGGKFTIRASYGDVAAQQQSNTRRFQSLVLLLPPIIHGVVQGRPTTLGELDAQFSSRGLSLFERLTALIRSQASEKGLCSSDSHCLILVSIPILRQDGGPVESYEHQAYLVQNDIAHIGVALGALHFHDGKFWAVRLLDGGLPTALPGTWQNTAISPADLVFANTRSKARQFSGIQAETADFHGILAGVGALGSALAQAWAKQAWGEWTYVDPDILLPHNIARHLAPDVCIGVPKAQAVSVIVQQSYQGDYYQASSIHGSIIDSENPEVKAALAAANLLIDASTTLEVPRDLSASEQTARSASVFLTPSGNDSVLLMEDKQRAIRLDSLEAQYYRAIITSEWGSKHLEGHSGSFWVGGGCRDISTVLSYDLVQLHAAMLARQVRLHVQSSEPRICVWRVDDDSGSLAAHNIAVAGVRIVRCDSWCVNFDSAISEKLASLRLQHSPKETGGVLVGYIDQKSRAIYVVDALPSPPDSQGDQSGYTRGVEGLAECIRDISQRTAGIVDYIGEWHSHPPFTSALPSSQDRHLVRHLARVLARDGLPALMMIIGDADEISVTVLQKYLGEE